MSLSLFSSRKHTHAAVFSILVSAFGLTQQFGSAATPLKSPMATETEINWWKGDPEKAFETAKAEQKFLFVYWGAVWCPPCNEMKVDVFPKPEFQNAISSMIPVMIDGDSKDAQKWSDKLGATGYPTVMIFDPHGLQKLRFVGFTPLPTIVGAIKSAQTSSQSLNALAFKASKAEPMTADEWRILAFGDWTTFKDTDLGGKSAVDVALDALDKMPQNLTSERALLAVYVLYAAENASPASQRRIKESFDRIFSILGSSADVRMSILDFLSWGAPTLKWSVTEGLTVEAQRSRVDSWSKLIESTASKSGDSLTERLNIAAARASIVPLQTADPQHLSVLSKELKSLETELFKLRDQHQLTSLLPKLADAYAAIGDKPKAYKVLERAAARSSVPYYFMGHLASLLDEAGDKDKAVQWREKAMRASSGSATRIQWTWSYLNSVQKSTLKDKDRRLENGIIDILKRALETEDGLNGRSRRYLDKTSELIGKLPKKSKKLVSTVESLQKQCEAIEDNDRQATCKTYFSAIDLKDREAVGQPKAD